MKSLYILLFILGTMALLGGVAFLLYMVNFKKNAIRATGTVIEIKTSTGRTTSITYSPVIKFRTFEGKECIYDVSSFSYTKYQIGDKIEVLYSRNDPTNVIVDSFYNMFMPPLVIIITGIFTLGISLLFYYKK
jgi:hypothetical protein